MTLFRQDRPERVVEGKRLGQSVLHDSRSWRFPAPMSDKIQTVFHEQHGLPLDQGSLGSCTGNALVAMLMSGPFYQEGRIFTEEDAVAAYSWATHKDRFKGVYPPNDTGSNGLTVCKYAIEKKWAKGYGWSFGLEHALRTISIQPTITGSVWVEGMDEPDNEGVVHVTGAERGGHEYAQVGLLIYDAKNILTSPENFVVNIQSWGDWGPDGGLFKIPVPEYGQLLKRNGDVKTLIV